MDSLNSLIRDARPNDPLARAMEAIVDSGLILFTRDSGGHFVQLSEVLGARLGMGDARGARQPGETQIFNAEGRALAGSEYPAAKVRATGQAQRNVLRRIERGGRHLWALMSTMPLERTPDGYSALTIGTDVTEIVDERDAARRASSMYRALAELGARLAGGGVSERELLEALRQPMADLIPDGNVLLARPDGLEFEMVAIHHGFGAQAPAGRALLSSAVRDRWRGPGLHLNLDVQPTDIYCARVVAELDDPYRSVAVAPCGSFDEPAALVATHPDAGALNELQTAGLALASQLIRSALYADETEVTRASA